MKKKLLLACLIVLAFCALGLTACDNEHTHFYGEWTTVTEPMCTTAGSKERVCTCGEKETDTIPATGHTFGEWTTVTEPTCTTAGSKERVCTCGEKETETISATGHALGTWTTVAEPSCTNFGYKERVCSCGEKQQEILNAKGHNLASCIEKASTCTEPGHKAYEYCDRDKCGYTTFEPIPATYVHNFVNGLCLDCSTKQPTDGLQYTLSYDGTYYELFGIGTAMLTDIVIADYIDGKPVKTIRDNAFSSAGVGPIESVFIPNTVIGIGDGAFSGCRSLQNIEIPDSVMSIGLYAFSFCNSLQSVQIPDSVKTIKAYAFSYCSSLQSVTISNGITAIEGGVFARCDLLQNIVIPDGVTSIGEQAFYYCTSLQSIEIPDGVTSIGDSAFSGCSLLQSIEIPDGVTSIGDSAFRNCTSLQNILVDENNLNYKSIDGNLYSKDGKTLIQYAIGKTATEFVVPDSVTSIGERAFLNCTSLQSIVIPDSVTSIGDYAFYYCTSLQSIVIPDSVTSIGERAFYYCTSLQSIEIPDSVTSIGDDAFYCCYKLVEVINKSSLTIEKGSSDNGDVGYYALRVLNEQPTPSNFVTEGDYTFYKYEDKYYLMGYTGSQTELTLPESVDGDNSYEIYKYAFYRNGKITSVIISDGVTSIGHSAFSYCTSLQSIVIPDSVTSIGDSAFFDCRSLQTVYYTGSADEWNNISIIDSFNSYLTDATRYYYSESEPALNSFGTEYIGDYWHYVDGVVTVWIKE